MNDTYRYPLAFKGLLTNPYTFIEGQDLVQASGNDVTVNTDPVFVQTSRSEEHTSELQSLMRISYAVFCLKKKQTFTHIYINDNNNIYNSYSNDTNFYILFHTTSPF